MLCTSVMKSNVFRKNICGVSLKFILIILALFALVACESLPGKLKSKPQQEEGINDDVAGVEDQPPFESIPNPYNANASVPPQAKVEFAQAKTLMSQKKWKEAEVVLLLMTQTYPELSGPYVNLGIIYTQLDQPEDAIKAFLFAIETNKTNMDAYSQLGLTYREQGEFLKAEQTYQDALAVWPHDPNALRGLGILYDLYMGKLEPALVHYKLLAKINGPKDRQLKGWIIDIERRIPKTLPPEADQQVAEPSDEEITDEN